MRHTISLLVENKFGVLSRVSGLFSGRGYNIESISVGETIDPAIAQMTIVTTGDDQIIEQITNLLNKVIDIIRLTDLTELDHVEREMILKLYIERIQYQIIVTINSYLCNINFW